MLATCVQVAHPETGVAMGALLLLTATRTSPFVTFDGKVQLPEVLYLLFSQVCTTLGAAWA
jgi:hypothetical protein